jgi:hypothetical protein
MQGKFIQEQQRQVLYILTIILVTLFLLRPPQVAATTAQEFISNGEDFLYTETVDGLLQAHSIFQNAKAAYPDDPVINGYLALTRLFHLALTSESGGLQELLTKYGIVRTGLDLDTLDYDLPKYGNDKYNVPQTAPGTESARVFMSGELLSALDASIGNLDTTIATWNDTSKHIVAKEKRGTDIDIEVDYGDIYLFRASLMELKSMVLTITAYDLNVDIREIAALDNLEAFSEKDFFDRYQDFFRLIPTSATPTGNGINQLALARTVMIDAIDDYLAASPKIRNDTDLTIGAEELIEIDECDYLMEEWFRESLTKIKTTLSNASNPAAEIPDQEEEWLFTDVATGNHIEVSLEHNRGQGEFDGLEGGDFVGWSGDIECLTINGNLIYIEMEAAGWPYSEIAFSGTLNGTSDAISGRYNGWSAAGPVSGNFNATRLSLSENIERINLNPFFGNGSGPYHVRDFLPRFNTCDNLVPDTVGYGLNPSAPDATLGGILPDYTQTDWNLDPVNCNPTGGSSSITGTLSVPAYSSQGPIYIQAFQYFGQTIMDFDSRIAMQVIYPDEFNEGMLYNLFNLPAGVQVFISVWWDADFNGILTSADLIKYTSPFTTQSGPTNMNLRLTSRFIDAMPWVHMLLLFEN